MAITSHLAHPSTADRDPTRITCPRYAKIPGSNRCQHFADGGGCALPDVFMCVEWEKRNPHLATSRSPGTTTATSPPPPSGPQAFDALPLTGTACSVCAAPQRRTPHGVSCRNGHGDAPPLEKSFALVNPEPPPAPPVTVGTGKVQLAPDPNRPPLRISVPAVGDVDPKLITPESVEQLERAGYEITLESDAGDVVLVPRYTGSPDRQELTYEDARVLVLLVTVLPRPRLKKLTRVAKNVNEDDIPF